MPDISCLLRYHIYSTKIKFTNGENQTFENVKLNFLLLLKNFTYTRIADLFLNESFLAEIH